MIPRLLTGLLFFLLVVPPVYAGITYSDPVITIDDSVGVYDSWANCATPEDIYDDPDVPASAFYYVETTDRNTTWVLNQSKIVNNAGSFLCFDYISLTIDYEDGAANPIIVNNKGYMRINATEVVVEGTGITNKLRAVYSSSGSTTYITNSYFTSSGAQVIMLALWYGASDINDTSISGAWRAIQTYLGTNNVNRLTVNDCYENGNSYGVHNMITPSTPWTDIKVKGCDAGYQVHYEDSTAYKVQIEDCGDPANGRYCWDNGGSTGKTHYLVDSSTNWSSVEVQSGHTHYQAYTFNVRVKESDELESYISGVNITLYNQDGSQAFTVLSDANGEISEQEVNFRKWIYTGSNPAPIDTEYYPFALVLTKSGYQDVNLSVNYSVIEGRGTEGVDLEVALIKTVLSVSSDQDAINQAPSATHHIKTVGTPYTTSDTVTIGAMVINGSTGQAISADNVTLTVYYPNSSIYLQNAMTQLAGSDPIIYNYSFVMPDIRGVYLYTLNSSNPVADAMGETQNINWSSGNISTDSLSNDLQEVIVEMSAIAIAILAAGFLYLSSRFEGREQVMIRVGSIACGILLAVNVALIALENTAVAYPAFKLLIWAVRFMVIILLMYGLFRALQVLRELPQKREKQY